MDVFDPEIRGRVNRRVACERRREALPDTVLALLRCREHRNFRKRSMHATETSETPPQTEPAMRTVAMPADANPWGDIFGGWMLSQMDLAGGTVATRRARGRTATVAITAMTFHRPVFVGDEVSCYVEIIKIGTTSITVKVESWVRRGTSQEQIEVTEGIFTYVAIGADRKPCPVPPES
jgi:acyl-CoA thioesterase YciA